MEKAHLQLPDGQLKPLKEWFTIGSDENCDLILPSAAPRHARLEKTPDGWLLKDLRSPTGTWLNRNRIIEAYLQPGDLIRCGEAELFLMEKESSTREFPLSSRNPEWNELLKSLGHVAKTSFPILLMGPSGTGKDVIAQALHKFSPRSHGPLVSVNCGALTESLVESELFGHVKGSFTGALNDRKGAFEAARGGTLFLDEIGDLPMVLQSKLLRALENNEIRPVGSDRTVRTDVRIVAATHHDLEDRVREGLFRQDLYFRLNVISISPPSLKNRMEDFEDLLYGFCRSMRVRFSVAAIRRLEKHTWPGNIRELKNLVARACALFPQTSIEETHIEKLLSARAFQGGLEIPATEPSRGAPLPVIQEIERQMIMKRLRANKGNQRRTANDLGLPKSTLHDRIRTYGIDLDSFRV
ncbi:MAG: sigma 54-dependent Fis family transcriptional regulator [Bdellovibrionaceae bacterium]|nr:sigma 54-dependent Fis family transcriptional regulator [Pseudobdellovibrionaceae bacterium]